MKTILTAVNAKYIHSNLAVYSLRAYADKYKENIEIAEYTINQQTDDILMDLYKKRPDVLCFSCYIWNLTVVEELVREIRKLYPTIPIWLGGPEVSYDAADVLQRLPEVTGVMFGEGEETFLELMEHYHGEGKDLADILGIAYRDRGEVCINEWRKTIDLSTVPFVYSDMEQFENKIIYYESSRGCPFSCSYCLSSVDKCLRFRDLDLVKKELQFFIDAKVPQVKFVDRTFNCNHKHAMEIWQYLHIHDQGITNFHFEVAADLLNEEELSLIEKMRPGLIQLEIGVQSTNEKTIREIRRTMKFDEVARIVNRINAGHNVHQHLDLIAGLPYEDLESFKKSFNDVYHLYPEQLQLGFLKVLKGSYMDKNKESYGLIHKSKPPYEVLGTRWLSYEDLLELKMVEQMVEIYYNSGQFAYTLRHLERHFESPYELYYSLGKYYEEEGLHMMSHSRITRYEILLDFIRTFVKEEEDLYLELLTFDLYLREHVKNRPTFAGDYTVSKELKREYPKSVHLERFSYDVMGECERKEQIILFDYEKRSKLTHQASCKILQNSLQ
jgi:radical SAM superfamily enzyme YgiQ (UPF0313 family)